METNDLSYEPMDIDLSSQSVRDMDISYHDNFEDMLKNTRSPSRISISRLSNCADENSRMNKSTKSTPEKTKKLPTVKKYHINIKKSHKTNSYKITLLKLIIAVTVIFISIIIYNLNSLKCCEIEIDALREKLSSKLYGQTAAINLLIKSLGLETKSKVLFFTGGTGVGKTFTSLLLLDTLGSHSNVYHYTMPTFEKTFSTDLMYGLIMCKMSLIIVDDLTINDKNVMIPIKTVIEKSESLGKEITVILIYNCIVENTSGCDGHFHDELMENFSDIQAFKRFIHFEPLTEKHLKQCITEELGNRELSDLELNSVLKNFNVSADGCKGVHSKIKYLNSI